MTARLVQRVTVVALVCATLIAAGTAYLVPTHRLHATRSGRIADARHRIDDSLRRRAYYLEDVADMVGVHDDADVMEFSRYAHVRGREEGSIVAVQWLRRSPSGKLLPPVGVSPDPVLVTPADGNQALADAAKQATAAGPVSLASRRKKVAISKPVRLANGDSGFYLAVPVQAHRFSGLLSKRESQSAVVGLIDAQVLVGEELSGRPNALRLRDQVTPLASVGSGLQNATRAIVPAAGRQWVLSVDGGSLSALERMLPWLILAIGLGLAMTVELSLRYSFQRREMALRLARERSSELAHSTAMIQRITGAIDECFYTYTLDADGSALTRFATSGWGRVLGIPEDSEDAAVAWARAVHPDDADAHGRARERLRAGESTDLEFRVLDSDGEVHWLWAREHPVGEDDGAVVVDGVVSDISGRKAAEGELEQAHAEADRLSRMDALTGVFNRRHFSEVLAGQLASSGRLRLALLMIDLDHFKRVNDVHGHLIGDAVLRASAERIASMLRASDCLARWGGEEFAVLAPATDRDGAARLAERARETLAERPVEVDGIEIDLTASIGVVVAGPGRDTPDLLVEAADQALYAAKDAGRNCVRVHADEATAPARPAALS